MGVQSLTGGNTTNRIPTAANADAAQRRADRDKTARGNLAAFAMDHHPQAWGTHDNGPQTPEVLAARQEAAGWWTELLDALGLDEGGR